MEDLFGSVGDTAVGVSVPSRLDRPDDQTLNIRRHARNANLPTASSIFATAITCQRERDAGCLPSDPQALARAAVAVVTMLSLVPSEPVGTARADTQFDKLKSILGDKDQDAVAQALSQAAALARICKRQIDAEQFQNAMRISGIEAQDLAEGGKLFESTQEGRASVDATGCNGADGSFGPDGAEIPGILR